MQKTQLFSLEPFKAVVKGLWVVFSPLSSPLYRYPYRYSSEGLRADLKRVGKDVMTVLEDLREEHEQKHG